MNPEIVPIHRKEYLREDGMIFVRTEGILETMAKVPLILAGLIVATIMVPMQTSFGSTRTLEFTIYSDGSTHVSSQLDIDPLNPEFETNLFGLSVDNFVAVGENGFLLSSEIIENTVSIDTFGSSIITINYDTHDLVSKEGRVWTFSFNSPSDYSLIMPENSVIIGMSALPNNMEITDDQTRLELPGGPAEINYIFGASTPQNNSKTPQTNFDYSSIVIITVPVIGAIAGIVLILKKRQSKLLPQIDTSKKPDEIKEQNTLDVDTVFNLRPEMREDDKEIVKFISEKGGEVLESDLRKKFLQPRTTMWRAVKRLERLGVVEITKKDLQNMVKLKEKLEAEE